MSAGVTTNSDAVNHPTIVCDSACLRVIESTSKFKAIPLADWLATDSVVDAVICNSTEKTESVQLARAHDMAVFIVAIVKTLKESDVSLALAAGADEVTTVAEIASGRFTRLLAHRRLPVDVCVNQQQHENQSNQQVGLDCNHKTEPSASRVQYVQETMEMRQKFMAALNEVSMRLLDRKPLDEIMDHIALQTSTLTGVESAFVSMIHESGQYMEIVGATGRFVEHKGFKHTQEEDVVGLAWQLEDLVVFEEHGTDDASTQLWGGCSKRCAVPFCLEGRIGGVVCVGLDSAQDSLDNDLDILTLFTRTVSIAIENSILINEQKSELERHRAIGEILQSISTVDSLGEMIDSSCKWLLGVFESKHASICKVTDEGKYTLLAEWQQSDSAITKSSYVNTRALETSIAQWCVDNKKSVVLQSGVEDERNTPSVEKVNKLLGLGSSITMPLVQDNSVWGVLTIARGLEQRDFSDVDLSLLDLLMSHVSSSAQRQNLLDEVHFQAFHDSLTQLPNRLSFESKLKELVENEKQEKFALLFLDLDGFKAVNDNQGHSVGDELLIQVSNRLNGCLHDKDLLARIGGDEFAVLLRGVKTKDSALAIANRLCSAVGKNFSIEKYNLKIGVSIGLSFYPDNGDTVDELLRNADFAMYEAKADGKSGVKSFNNAMAEQYRARTALESDLLSAIEQEQFELYYQPKVDLAEQRVSGVEALVRWRHPKHGFISPADFIPLAEDAGYITEIGGWVVDEAIRQSAQWASEGLGQLTMAINISAPQFVLEDFSMGVINTLEKYDVEPSQLELEITESVVMNNVARVTKTLGKLQSHGIRIAIDDFGTGYSSLAYLEDLPIDCIKIDKVFVDKLALGSEQYSLVNTIVTMARALGLSVVAEGVESDDQIRKLEALGCECVQGYYFSRPVIAADIFTAIGSIEERFFSQRKAG